MWTEITDLVIFRKKLLKFLQGAAMWIEFSCWILLPQRYDLLNYLLIRIEVVVENINMKLFSFNCAYFYHRYLELIFPIWHKTHFKMTYLYSAMAMCWIFGIGYNLAYVIPTSKVRCRMHAYCDYGCRVFAQHLGGGIQQWPMTVFPSLFLEALVFLCGATDFSWCPPWV